MVNVCYTRQNTIEIEKETRSAALESLTLHCNVVLHSITQLGDNAPELLLFITVWRKLFVHVGKAYTWPRRQNIGNYMKT